MLCGADVPGGTFPISAKPSASKYTPQQERSLQQACLAAKIADDYRGRDILLLDLTKVTPVIDFFVIVTGTSKRQMHAIAEEVDRALADAESNRIGIEGYAESTWILQDYGDVVLHVFTQETRQLYDLEHLWADAERIDWQAQLGSVS